MDDKKGSHENLTPQQRALADSIAKRIAALNEANGFGPKPQPELPLFPEIRNKQQQEIKESVDSFLATCKEDGHEKPKP